MTKSLTKFLSFSHPVADATKEIIWSSSYANSVLSTTGYPVTLTCKHTL